MEQPKTCKMKTALHSQHCALGAKMTEFCGWDMPIQYQGIIQEHLAVRQKVGLFDVSHMGRILVQGSEAENFLDYLSANKISGKNNDTATYTVWCQSDGGCIDDVIIYRQNSTNFFVIVNAGNRQTDLAHLLRESQAFDVQIKDCFQEEGILSLQGPSAESLVALLLPQVHLPTRMHFMEISFQGSPLIVASTGYTGAGGFEFFAENKLIVQLWDLFLDEGKIFEIQPVGLGARDTLRLEMGYALYGHELSAAIAPIESVSAWSVHLDKKNFLGQAALQQLEGQAQRRFQYGIELLQAGVARADYEVFKNDRKIGRVTSGTHSPSLNKAIAIVLVEGVFQEGDILEVQIRQNRCKAKIVKLPFLRRINEVHRLT